MKIVFRADASVEIGTGHVMRCLALADSLRAKGAICYFICKLHAGNLISFIQSKGHMAYGLPVAKLKEAYTENSQHLPQFDWLGGSQIHDAELCEPILKNLNPDWLVVDHYALSSEWENLLRPHCNKLLVIDDLADRNHNCDLLLDQTFGRSCEDYHSLTPPHCHLLCGPSYALLRQEFASLRPYSLSRREQPEVQELFVNMGGTDKDNVTGQVLNALRKCELLPEQCKITVVMGTTAPWLEDIRKIATKMHRPTRVLVGVNNMAKLMSDSDLAIGAAGATTWERCCLGLPTAIMVLAENQLLAAGLLEKAGVVKTLTAGVTLPRQLNEFIRQVMIHKDYLRDVAIRASNVTDGLGCNRVAQILLPNSIN
jgi:UDP-2,4-diacetamido-2,4,6-trideoxy-beta-L-altropyranose hydrolase